MAIGGRWHRHEAESEYSPSRPRGSEAHSASARDGHEAGDTCVAARVERTADEERDVQ